MESQIRPHYEHEDHSQQVEEDDQQHHEKKSVLKKVKAQAKKIKDTLTKHGHGGHDHVHDEHGAPAPSGLTPHDHDLDEEDDDEDEDQQFVEDAELYGAPMYEGAAVRNAIACGQLETPFPSESSTAKQGQNFPISTADKLKDETTRRSLEDLGFTSGKSTATKGATDWSKKPIEISSQTGQRGESNVVFGRPINLEKDPDAPNSGMKADPPRNHEAKATDPARTGSEEVRNSGLVGSFAKMKFNEEPRMKETGVENFDEIKSKCKPSDISTGSHDQFSPEPNPTNLDFENHPENQSSSYTQKLSAVAGKAFSAKDYVASKLGYGEQQHKTNAEGQLATLSPMDYRKKIAPTGTEKLSPVYERARGSENDKGISVKDYLAEKLKPSEEDKALSEIISDALYKRKGEVKVGLRGMMLSGQERSEVTEFEEALLQMENEGGRSPPTGMDGDASSNAKTVADKLKDTVGSWLGKPKESPTSHQSIGSSQGVEGFTESSPIVQPRRRRQQGGEAEVRILQESAH